MCLSFRAKTVYKTCYYIKRGALGGAFRSTAQELPRSFVEGDMRNERRDTPRIPITLETIVNYNNRNYQHSTTRDISLDGAFVESKSEKLPKKRTMELAIKLPSDGLLRYHRFHAQVVRVTRNGAGIVFDRVDTDSYAALLDLVFSRQGRGLW